jgi:hypothetical protein
MAQAGGGRNFGAGRGDSAAVMAVRRAGATAERQTSGPVDVGHGSVVVQCCMLRFDSELSHRFDVTV